MANVPRGEGGRWASPLTPDQTAALVGGLIARESMRSIARRIGVAASTVSRAAKRPETAALVRAERERLAAPPVEREPEPYYPDPVYAAHRRAEREREAAAEEPLPARAAPAAQPPKGRLVRRADGTAVFVPVDQPLAYETPDGLVANPLIVPPKPKPRRPPSEPSPAPPPQVLGQKQLLRMAIGVEPQENRRFAFFGQDDEVDDRDLAAWLTARDRQFVLRDSSGKRMIRTSDEQHARELEAAGFTRER